MQERGDVSQDEYKLSVLDARQEMTGADRQPAGQYGGTDVVRCTRGSKVLGSTQANMPALNEWTGERTDSASNERTEITRLTIRANRFACVSVSRAQYDARIYTNDRSELARSEP